MTSLKQIEANRRNALRSTGPRTEEGKQRSSRNALRHGLTAETVLEPLEDPDDYQAFEQAVTADYDAKTAVERELILRLASLLWRLRRATLIETGLLNTDNELLQEFALNPGPPANSPTLLRPQATENFEGPCNFGGEHHHDEKDTRVDLNVAKRFLQIAKMDSGMFERLGRYEMTLWRQARQIICALERFQWRSLRAGRPNKNFWQRRNEKEIF